MSDTDSPLQDRAPNPIGPPVEAGGRVPGQGAGSERYTGFALWLHRSTVLMFVFLCAVIGVLLIILPWREEWTDNYLLLTRPDLRSFVSHGFVRGLVTGLGVLDVWIGFWEALHYHEEKRLK